MTHRNNQPRPKRRAVTMLELLVVVLIIGILATIATNVYTGQTLKAKNAAALNTIREIAVAATRYEIDTGELPLSGSGNITPNVGGVPTISSRTPAAGLTGLGIRGGCGFLYLELTHSLSGYSSSPYPRTWAGPYLEFPSSLLLRNGCDTGNPNCLAQIQLLDPFGEPYNYVQNNEYIRGLQKHFDITISQTAVGVRGTRLYTGNKPASANIDLPDNSPFAATETFYNPKTFQIFSTGFNETTFDGIVPPTDDPGINFQGTERDDINNFGW